MVRYVSKEKGVHSCMTPEKEPSKEKGEANRTSPTNTPLQEVPFKTQLRTEVVYDLSGKWRDTESQG